MNLYDIFAGIDRHFRLREEGRQRRAAAEAGVSFEWPRDTNLTREQMEIAVQDGTPSIGWQPGPTPVLGDGPTMPMRSLSNDNYDQVWIAEGDDVRAMGVGDTPQEAAIEYARAVADLLRPTGGPDALDSKTAIRAQLAACRGECGDGPPTWEEWAR
jgi:hypothetical protein